MQVLENTIIMKSQELTSQSRFSNDTLNFQINSDSGDEMKNNVILFPKIKIAKKMKKLKKIARYRYRNTLRMENLKQRPQIQ